MAKITLQRNLTAEVEVISTSKQLESVLNSKTVFDKVQHIRNYRDAGNQKMANSVKLSLPGVIFVADDFAVSTKEIEVFEDGEKVKKQQQGKWRLQKSAHLNGLAVLDADHLTESPKDIFSRWSVEQLREWGVFMVFVTSSNAGLKVVFRARKEWGNLIDNAVMMGQLLGLPVDESCKDASRMSFAPSTEAGDVLYNDADGMFAYDGSDYDECFGEAYRQGNSQPTGPKPQAPVVVTPASSEEQKSQSASASSDVRKFGISGIYYKDVPIQRIVDCWIGPVLPKPGERHATSLSLADELRYITDSDAQTIEAVLRAQPWVDEIVRERGENVAQTVKSAMAYRELKHMPKRMMKAAIAAGVQISVNDDNSKLPYDEWAQRLSKIKLGCYKSTVAYVENPQIHPGAIIQASGMFGTLMTRCWYYDWEGIMHRINVFDVVVGKPASGKGFANELNENIMQVMREADEPGREAENEYKQSVKERGTSQKEQKKEALKRPQLIVRYCPVKTSNNIMYHRMENAYILMPDGKKFPLHLYTFSSEIMTIVKAGGSFQDKRDMYLQAFTNEENGVDYANIDSVNGCYKVYYNVVMTGTKTSLDKLVNLSNIGDGLSTRMSCFIMPETQFKMRPYRSEARSTKPAEEMEKWGRFFDSLQGEIKGLDRLKRHIYEIVRAKSEEAAAMGDMVTLKLCMRMQDKLIAVCLPHVISTQASLEEFQKTMTVKVTKQHTDFASLMFDIMLSCEDALFGELWQAYFDNEQKAMTARIKSDRTIEMISKLPDDFTTADVKELFGYTAKTSASDKCKELMDAGVIERIGKGRYHKLKAV